MCSWQHLPVVTQWHFKRCWANSATGLSNDIIRAVTATKWVKVIKAVAHLLPPAWPRTAFELYADRTIPRIPPEQSTRTAMHNKRYPSLRTLHIWTGEWDSAKCFYSWRLETSRVSGSFAISQWSETGTSLHSQGVKANCKSQDIPWMFFASLRLNFMVLALWNFTIRGNSYVPASSQQRFSKLGWNLQWKDFHCEEGVHAEIGVVTQLPVLDTVILRTSSAQYPEFVEQSSVALCTVKPNGSTIPLEQWFLTFSPSRPPKSYFPLVHAPLTLNKL